VISKISAWRVVATGGEKVFTSAEARELSESAATSVVSTAAAAAILLDPGANTVIARPIGAAAAGAVKGRFFWTYVRERLDDAQRSAGNGSDAGGDSCPMTPLGGLR
jgi:hypothetical protein